MVQEFSCGTVKLQERVKGVLEGSGVQAVILFHWQDVTAEMAS